MQLFINECSLHEQFCNHTEINSAFLVFIKILNALEKFQDKHVYKSREMYDRPLTHSVSLAKYLKSNSDIANRFKIALDMNHVELWNKNQLHDPLLTYSYDSNNYSGTSLAEITERKFANNGKYCLINFKDSDFADLCTIKVIKNNSSEIQIDCIFNDNSTENWLLNNDVLRPEYNVESNRPPLDNETVLRDESLFKKTHHINQGRSVYRRVSYDELWVVDNFHLGYSAEIEVFKSSTGEHLGTSPINEISLDPSKRKPDRQLDL